MALSFRPLDAFPSLVTRPCSILPSGSLLFQLPPSLLPLVWVTSVPFFFLPAPSCPVISTTTPLLQTQVRTPLPQKPAVAPHLLNPKALAGSFLSGFSPLFLLAVPHSRYSVSCRANIRLFAQIYSLPFLHLQIISFSSLKSQSLICSSLIAFISPTPALV